MPGATSATIDTHNGGKTLQSAGVETTNGRLALAESTAAEILGSFARVCESGVLTFTSPDATCRLWTRCGSIYATAGSDPSNRLGERLREIGSLKPSVLQSALQTARTTHRFLGALLLEGGHLPPLQIREALGAQVDEAVRIILSWKDGHAEFEVSESTELAEGEVHVSVPIRPAVLRGLRMTTDIQLFIDRIGGMEQAMEPCYELDEAVDAGLDEREFELLRAVDGKRTLAELSATGASSEARNLHVLVALWALQFVRPVDGRMIRFPAQEEPRLNDRPTPHRLVEPSDLLQEGIRLYVKRDYKRALAVFDRCLEISPNNRRARYNRARVLRRIENR